MTPNFDLPVDKFSDEPGYTLVKLHDGSREAGFCSKWGSGRKKVGVRTQIWSSPEVFPHEPHASPCGKTVKHGTCRSLVPPFLRPNPILIHGLISTNSQYLSTWVPGGLGSCLACHAWQPSLRGPTRPQGAFAEALRIKIVPWQLYFKVQSCIISLTYH